MQATTRFSKLVRTAIVTGSLLAALALGSVMANDTVQGPTECDHGCKVELLAGDGEVARFQIISSTPFHLTTFVAGGSGDIGFTR